MCGTGAVEQQAAHVHAKATILGESSNLGGCGVGYELMKGVDMTPLSLQKNQRSN
jgi:hypothetical protein